MVEALSGAAALAADHQQVQRPGRCGSARRFWPIGRLVAASRNAGARSLASASPRSPASTPSTLPAIASKPSAPMQLSAQRLELGLRRIDQVLRRIRSSAMAACFRSPAPRRPRPGGRAGRRSRRRLGRDRRRERAGPHCIDRVSHLGSSSPAVTHPRRRHWLRSGRWRNCLATDWNGAPWCSWPISWFASSAACACPPAFSASR